MPADPPDLEFHAIAARRDGAADPAALQRSPALQPERAERPDRPDLATRPIGVLEQVLDQVGTVYVGQRETLNKVLAAALANGHVLFEDPPGLGKTLLVKAFSRVLGCAHSRIQFTPDLMPADITGARVWEPASGQFRFERGPVFTNVLLADEINRAPPKAQSALLEAMDERQVTIDGQTHRLESPFFCMATQNPLESEGTYPLPDAQLDRFLLRLSIGYANDLEQETSILRRRVAWKRDDPTPDLQPVTNATAFRAMQQAVEQEVFVHEDVLRYIATIVRTLRRHPRLEVGPSPRGGLALLRTARAMAYIRGRDFVAPDEVRALAVDALAHRCIVRIEHLLDGYRAQQAVEEVVRQTPPPARLQADA